MFLIALVILLIFFAVYATLAGAVIYHLRQYIVPGATAPHLATTIFLFLSGLFFLFSLYFLFQIPR